MTKSTYRGFVPIGMEINDRRFYVGVHLGLVNGRLVCVGIDLRSVNLGELAGEAMDLSNGEWVEMTTSILRAMPLGEAVDRALAERRLVVEVDHPSERDPAGSDTPRSASASGRPARGPRPLLDDGMLETVVGPAYRLGGRRPVQAVQEALENSGALPSRVTIDQARRAIVRARARGLVPPARTPKTKNEEDRP